MPNEFIPEIKPYDSTTYTCKQSKYEMVSKLPTRGLLVAPSNSGKSVMLQNLILNIYRGCFEKIYIFSPSIFIDSVRKPVIEYCEKELHQYEDSFLDEFSALANKEIIEHIYRRATDEPYVFYVFFLHIKLASRDINDMFYASWKKHFILTK